MLKIKGLRAVRQAGCLSTISEPGISGGDSSNRKCLVFNAWKFAFDQIIRKGRGIRCEGIFGRSGAAARPALP